MDDLDHVCMNLEDHPVKIPSRFGGKETLQPGDYVARWIGDRWSRNPGEPLRGNRVLTRVPLSSLPAPEPVEDYPAPAPQVDQSPCQTSCETACMSVPETDPHQMEVINQQISQSEAGFPAAELERQTAREMGISVERLRELQAESGGMEAEEPPAPEPPKRGRKKKGD